MSFGWRDDGSDDRDHDALDGYKGQRYADDEVDIKSHEGLDDDTSQSILERYHRNPWPWRIGIVLGGLSLIFVVSTIAPFFPTFTDPRLWGVIALVVVVGGLFLLGRRSGLNSILNMQVLVVYLDDGYYLAFGEESDQNKLVFKPFKSVSWLGLRTASLTVADLDAKFGAKVGRSVSGDEPVRIRLKKGFTHRGTGVFNRIIVSRGQEISVDKFSDDAHVTVALPERADEDAYRAMKKRSEAMRDDLSSQRERINRLESDLREARAEASRRRADIRKEIIDTHTELTEAQVPRVAQAVQPQQRQNYNDNNDE